MNSSVQDKLEKEKQALATQMQSGSKELEEKMARDEELRRQEAEALKVIGHIHWQGSCHRFQLMGSQILCTTLKKFCHTNLVLK